MAARTELIGSLVQRYLQGVKVFPGELTQAKLRELMAASSGRKQTDVLMKIAEANGWAHDAELHNIFISKFSKLGVYGTKMAVHKMRQNKLVPGREAYLSLGVAMGLETGRWKDVVEFLRIRGVLGEKEWATLIGEATSTESLQLYNIMKDRKVNPSIDVFHGLMKAHAQKTQVVLDSTSAYSLKGIFDEMRRMGVEPTEKTYELLTTLRHADVMTIKKMYYGMKKRGLTPTIPTYTHWIVQFSAENDWEWSGQLWEEVRGRLDEFETEDLTRVLQAFSTNPDPKIAIQILDTVVKKNLIEGSKGYNYILLSLAKQGDAKNCEKYFVRMQQDQYIPTSETYEYMMQAHILTNNHAKVIQYDKEMRARGLAPTRNAYRYLLAAHALAGDARMVDRVFSLMAQDRIRAEIEDYHILIQNAPTSNLVLKWYQATRNNANFVPKSDTTAIALHAFARTKDDKAAMALYNEISQEERREHHAYDAVLRACCAANSHVIFCKSVLNDARNSLAELQKETYDSLVEFFGKNGDQNLVLELANEMEQKGYEMSKNTKKMYEIAEKGGSLVATLLEEEGKKWNKKVQKERKEEDIYEVGKVRREAEREKTEKRGKEVGEGGKDNNFAEKFEKESRKQDAGDSGSKTEKTTTEEKEEESRKVVGKEKGKAESLEMGITSKVLFGSFLEEVGPQKKEKEEKKSTVGKDKMQGNEQEVSKHDKEIQVEGKKIQIEGKEKPKVEIDQTELLDSLLAEVAEAKMREKAKGEKEEGTKKEESVSKKERKS